MILEKTIGENAFWWFIRSTTCPRKRSKRRISGTRKILAWIEFGLRTFTELFPGGLERQWRHDWPAKERAGRHQLGQFIMMGGLIAGDGRQGGVVAYVVSGIWFLGGRS
jgi:hypothetical protein